MGDDNPLSEKILKIPKANREPQIQPNGVLDDRRWGTDSRGKSASAHIDAAARFCFLRRGRAHSNNRWRLLSYCRRVSAGRGSLNQRQSMTRDH